MCKLSTSYFTFYHFLMVISGLSRAIRDGVAELQIGQTTILAVERWQKINQWLSSPDPSSNHNAACQKRQQTTGSWFIRGDQFAEWKINSNSFLWLHGIRRLTSLRGWLECAAD